MIGSPVLQGVSSTLLTPARGGGNGAAYKGPAGVTSSPPIACILAIPRHSPPSISPAPQQPENPPGKCLC